MPPLGGITPLTCTIFDPTFCGRFHSFNFAQICVLDSYRPTLPLSPYNVANRHKHAHRGNSTTSSHISISVAIPEVYARFCGMVPPALTFIAERKAQSRIGTFICFHQYTNDCLKLVVYSTLLFLYYQSVLYIVVQNYSASY